MTLHVAADADDVVVDFVPGILDTINRDFGANLQPDDITDWNFGQFIDDIIGEDWWTWMEKHAWLWGEKFKPVPGALGGLETLRRAGHRVEMLTSKPEWAERQMWVWAARYGPKVSSITQVPLGENKTLYTSAQVLIDDRDKNVLEWVQSDENRWALLYDRAHNRDFDQGVEPRIMRVKSWTEVLRYIGAIDWEVHR